MLCPSKPTRDNDSKNSKTFRKKHINIFLFSSNFKKRKSCAKTNFCYLFSLLLIFGLNSCYKFCDFRPELITGVLEVILGVHLKKTQAERAPANFCLHVAHEPDLNNKERRKNNKKLRLFVIQEFMSVHGILLT